jgi:hypothetical protein
MGVIDETILPILFPIPDIIPIIIRERLVINIEKVILSFRITSNFLLIKMKNIKIINEVIDKTACFIKLELKLKLLMFNNI